MPHPSDRCRTCGAAWHQHCPCLDGGRCLGADGYCHRWAYWIGRVVETCWAPVPRVDDPGYRRWVDECAGCVRHSRCRFKCSHTEEGPCPDLVGGK
jgi:hypothetical protein